MGKDDHSLCSDGLDHGTYGEARWKLPPLAAQPRHALDTRDHHGCLRSLG